LLLRPREIPSCVWVSGFDRKPDDVAEFLAVFQDKVPTVDYQIFDLDKIPGSRYIIHAVVNAWKSFNSKRPISHTLGMEMLLYVAANKQINEAIEQVGVSENTHRLAAVALGNSEREITRAAELTAEILGVKGKDSLLDEWNKNRTGTVRHVFSIKPKELRATKRNNEKEWQAVERLAIERSAMLALKK
jgi:tRNA threonylcarbamoyladenosine modification (KEOPS) complex Cgi121 subunit